MNKNEILKKVDHTVLAQTATWEQIKNICDDGIKYNVASVCIPPSYVKDTKKYVGDKLKVCTVIGFPNGYNTTNVKVYETLSAIEEGADEIDMVINLGWLKDKKYVDIQLFKKELEGTNVKIKAAGGIKSFEDAEKFIEFGADRLGTSRLVNLMK